MGKGRKSGRMWRGLCSVTASLLAILIAGLGIANANAAIINVRMGLVSDVIVETGEGEIDSIYYDSEFSSLEEMVKAKNALAEEISSEGSVLFKNNGALPLNKGSEKVTLWGLNSHTPTLGGMIGSSTGFDPSTGQVAYGIEEAMTEKGFSLNQDMIDLYSSDPMQGFMRRGFGQPGHGLTPAFTATYENQSEYPVGEIPASLYSDDVLKSADGTAAVVVLSRDSSEAADYYPTEKNTTEGDSYERPLALSDYEKAMIELAKKHSTKVIVLLNADNPLEIDELKKDAAIDAILWVGAPGMNGFLGVADVLSGDVNPSGHISDTYAVNSTSSPAMMNFGVYTYDNASNAGGNLTEANKADWFLVENEGIYVGYKYYETRYEDEVLGQGNASNSAGSSNGTAWKYENEVSYPFGYGLSYTTFEQTLDDVTGDVGGTGEAAVTVKNTGDVAGKSVAQLYVQAPYIEGGVEKSAVQLLGFAKTGIIEPGASETVTVSFDPRYMASYDTEAVKADGTKGAWILDSGSYYFSIGNGAHEALNNIIAKKLGSSDSLVTTTDDDVINPDNVVEWKIGARDIETYSANVENQLQEADINTFLPGTIEYVTRSDWSKGWTTVDSLMPTDEMMVGLTNSMYELTKNGDGVTWGKDSDLKLIDLATIKNGKITGFADFDDPRWDELLDELTLDEAIQFIEKGGDDIENINSILLPRLYENDGPLGFTYDQVAGYDVRWSASDSSRPTYVASTDPYAKYADNTMPTEPVVAATWNTELVKRQGELYGEAALWSKETGIIAPGMNLHRVPYNARNHEYYSEDAMLTSIMGTAVCAAMKTKGLQAQPKHLAFNHQETNRSGISTFMSEQAARENELRAFQEVMSSNACLSIMTAFNRVGTEYVGANDNLLVNIIRNEWGYMGSIVTDMINGADYMNWRNIVFGGGGNCLTTSAYDTSQIGTMAASKKAIAKDTEFQKQMKLGIKYWLYSLVQSNAMNGLTYTSELKHITTWWEKLIYALIAVMACLTVLFGGLYAVNGVRNKKAVKAEDMAVRTEEPKEVES
ncbi:MAG: glycoside hydrolase family 3 C-terminal domain-containing protein [Lachnospiraceae bacterium]|nr:glycoside hydrolase family 3 C-terminal domain-containing protein [Lachnospiraceae bacterium]